MASREAGATTRGRRRSYHHGNLRDALIDLAIELINRDGVASFSIAEACRRLNVSPGAPYRHFADREDLLTEIAIQACEVLTAHVAQVVGMTTDPVERLVRASRAYVEFAAQHPALFEVLYTKEVFLGGNAKLIGAVRPVVEAFRYRPQRYRESLPPKRAASPSGRQPWRMATPASCRPAPSVTLRRRSLLRPTMLPAPLEHSS